MKTMRQLLRQPMKTLFGVVLIATAVAVLCVCLGQSIAAKETEQRLNETYMTAAFAMADQDSLQSSWLSTYAAEHPEVVKAVSNSGLASAYIPELTADNWTEHWHNPLIQRDNMYSPYNTALLEIVLTDISEVPHAQYVEDTLRYCELFGTNRYVRGPFGYSLLPDSSEEPADDVQKPSTEDGVCIYLTGTVEKVICLQEGYADPTDFTVRLTLYLLDSDSFNELDLRAGERYLVYGTNYRDEDWILRHEAASQMEWYKQAELPTWKLETFEWIRDVYEVIIDEETREVTYAIRIFSTPDLPLGSLLYVSSSDVEDIPILGFKCKIGDLYHGMELADYARFRSVSMTLEGYTGQYQQPTIVHLTGTAEEFLSSKEGALWGEALHNVEVNNHAFAVIGVDKLRYLENFNSGEARIIAGRDFTNEELASGAKICVISKQLAESNGLNVGDTISPRFYDPDLSLEYQISMSGNTFTPKPFYYFGNTTQLQDTQTYTIVGIYEQNAPTPIFMDNYGNLVNPYGFTSNTIFAPKTAIDAEMQYSESWLFKTVVLQNGTLEDFQLAAIEAGVGDYFNYDDNGYSGVQTSLETYRENSRRASVIGGAVYGVLMLLFLVLFPCSQGVVLSVMEAMGAGNARKVGYLLSSSLGVLLPGTVVGTVCGAVLMNKVTAILSENATSVLGIRLDLTALLMIAMWQLVVCLLLVLILSISVTRIKALSKRK